MLNEQFLPDMLRLLLLRHRPKRLIRNITHSNRLSDQIVIREQLIDPPQHEPLEIRGIKMRVQVINRRGRDRLIHPLINLLLHKWILEQTWAGFPCYDTSSSAFAPSNLTGGTSGN